MLIFLQEYCTSNQYTGYGRTQRPYGVKRPCLLHQYPHGLWSKVVLKQICQGIELVINRYFEEARLPVTFYHEFTHFV